MENWIELTISLMDAVREELERVRWILYYWDIDAVEVGHLGPGVYEDVRDKCADMMGTLKSLLADLSDI